MLGIRISELPLYPDLSVSDQIPVAKGNTTYKLPGTAFTTTATNIGNGTGIFSEKKFTTLEFCSLSGTGSLNITKTSNNTIVLSVPQVNYVKTTAVGDSYTTTFTVNGSGSNNPNNYRVDIDGALQEPGTSYNMLSGCVVFTEPPALNSRVVILASPATNYYDVAPSDGSVTPQKLSVNSIYWTTNGNVGIGTTTPVYQLQLSTDSAAKPGSQLWTVVSDEE